MTIILGDAVYMYADIFLHECECFLLETMLEIQLGGNCIQIIHNALLLMLLCS